MVLLMTYGSTGADRRNPNWERLGYPGPVAVGAPAEERPITPLRPHGDLDLEADVVVIGSGAGGMILFSAHQMGSCRMGTDPATSVADPRRTARHPRCVDR